MDFHTLSDDAMDELIVGHYQQQQLPSTVKQRLSAMQSIHQAETQQAPRFALLLVASLLVGLSLIWVWSSQTSSLTASMEDIAHNMAAHHGYLNKSVPYHGETIELLASSMTRLDFDPHWPSTLAEWQVEGAKYCSVAGQVAMQVQLHHRSNHQRAMLYVSKRLQQLPLSTNPTHFSFDHITIDMWQDDHLFFGLTQDLSHQPNYQQRNSL